MEKILFIHIPKNAGTTLNQIIAKNFRKVCRLSWNHEDPNHYSRVLTKAGGGVFDDCDVIRGHFPYGLHKAIGGASRYKYMTMLRDPVRRTVSAFNYLNHDSTYVNNHPDLKQYINKLSIGDFVSYFHSDIPNHTYIDNAQVRYLSGVGESKPFGQLDILDLDVAKKNLAEMVFGLAEDFNRSILYFRRELPMKKTLYANRKVGSVATTKLSEEEEKKILERNEMDIDLYRYGKQLFQERAAFVTSEMLDDYDSKLKMYRYYDCAKSGIVRLARKVMLSK